MSQVEVERAKFPWIQLIIFTAILGVIENIWLALQPEQFFHFYIFGIVACPLQLAGGPFIVLIIAAALRRIMPSFKRLLTLRNIVLLYVVTVSTSWFTDYAANNEWYGEIFLGRIINPELSILYVPSFMAPSEQIVNQMVTGGYLIPWGEWVPAIMFWWLLSIIFGLLMVSIATVLRRGWIDIEAVPFPHVVASYELISNTTDLTRTSEERAARMRPFLIGIILGAVVQFPIWAQALFPWFPDIFGWRVNTCGHGGQWITADSSLGGIAGMSIFQKHPVFIAIGFLAPLSILLSTWFFYLIYLIAVQIAFVMGYYTGLTGIDGCGRSWCGTITPNFGEPFKFMALSYVGGSTALTALYLVLNRRYLMETFRAAFGKMSGEERSKLEEKEAMSYRSAYIFMGVFFILSVAIMMSIGLGIGPAILMPLTVFIFWLAGARIWGMAGATLQGAEHGNAFYRIFFWDLAPDPPTREYMLAGYFSEWMTDVPKAFGGATLSSFAAFRIASLANVDNKEVFKALMIGVIVGPLAVLITYIWLNYTFGLTRLAAFNSGFTDSLIDRTGNPENWNVRPGSTPWIPNMFAGIIIVGGLYILHARFVWFPLEPVGFILGTSYMSMLWGIWFPFLIAWVLKTLLLRFGGTKAYENFGVPVASGFIMGYMLIVLFGGLA
ncbi:MAG: DUF6785 family protein, partial [Thermoproteota archaeon]